MTCEAANGVAAIAERQKQTDNARFGIARWRRGIKAFVNRQQADRCRRLADLIGRDVRAIADRGIGRCAAAASSQHQCR